MSEKDEDREVVELFKQFKEQRQQESLSIQQKILDAAKTEERAPNTEDDAELESVKQVYQQYKQNRDPNRDEVISQVMDYAKRQHPKSSAEQTSTTDQIQASTESSKSWNLFTAPARALSSLMKHLLPGGESGLPTWQLAAIPVIAMAAILSLFLPNLVQDGVSKQLASVSIPGIPAAKELEQFGQATGSLYGFSGDSSDKAALFELGQITSQLQNSQFTETSNKKAANRINTLLKQLQQPAISVTSIDTTLPTQLAESTLDTSLFVLGYWTENAITLLETDSVSNTETLKWLKQTTPSIYESSAGKLGNDDAPQKRLLTKASQHVDTPSLSTERRQQLTRLLKNFRASMYDL